MLEIYESAGPPAHDLAFEAWMLDRAGQGQPCLLLSSWPGPVVVLGYAQPPEEADLALCRERHIPVLRRLTGGTGVVHTSDLGVALALPASHPWARGVVSLYDRFLDVLAPALAACGAAVERKQDPPRASRVRSPICFLDQLSDSLLVAGRKAVGCAQTRRRGAVLIHAAVLLNLDVELISGIFGVAPEVVAGRLTPALPGGDAGTLGREVARGFAAELGMEARTRPRPAVDPSYLEAYSRHEWSPLGFD